MQKILSMFTLWLTPDSPTLCQPSGPLIALGETRFDTVIDEMGAPSMVWRNHDGTMTWEYSPEFAHRASVILTVDADDVIVTYDLAATAERLEQIRPGMNGSAVRRVLGRPANTHFRSDNQQTLWRWYPRSDAACGSRPILAVLFDSDGHVIETRCDVE